MELQRIATVAIAAGGRGVLAAWLLVAGSAMAEVPGWQGRLVDAARAQVGVTLHYDGSYRAIAYPGGDVPLDRGVCTDVVVRAYRALGADLQQLVHEDMKRAFARYPRLWSETRPNPHIDHRRVPNLAVFFERHGQRLRPSDDARDYKAGDIVTWRLPAGQPHVGIVSGQRAPGPEGRPLIVHNIGAGTVMEDILFAYTITGHFRYAPPAAGR